MTCIVKIYWQVLPKLLPKLTYNFIHNFGVDTPSIVFRLGRGGNAILLPF